MGLFRGRRLSRIFSLIARVFTSAGSTTSRISWTRSAARLRFSSGFSRRHWSAGAIAGFSLGPPVKAKYWISSALDSSRRAERAIGSGHTRTNQLGVTAVTGGRVTRLSAGSSPAFCHAASPRMSSIGSVPKAACSACGTASAVTSVCALFGGKGGGAAFAVCSQAEVSRKPPRTVRTHLMLVRPSRSLIAFCPRMPAEKPDDGGLVGYAPPRDVRNVHPARPATPRRILRAECRSCRAVFATPPQSGGLRWTSWARCGQQDGSPPRPVAVCGTSSSAARRMGRARANARRTRKGPGQIWSSFIAAAAGHDWPHDPDRGKGYIRSGILMPRSSRPLRSTCPVRSQSASREARSAPAALSTESAS